MRYRLLLCLPLALWLAACSSSDSDRQTGETPAPAAEPMFKDLQVVRFPMGNTLAANPQSPFAGTLQDCTFSITRSDSCTLGELPLLGSEVREPTIDDVMDRVIVSHAWMGTRFRAVLERMPPDMLLLLRGVTAVVISSDVRPAFYWTRTGAIYLDPEYLWLTPSERATIPDDPDFRAGFGAALQFAMPWRYVKDNRHAIIRVPRGFEQPRPLEAILVDIGRLLYHELAHANDFFPPERQAGLARHLQVHQAVVSPIISDDLSLLMPLQSGEMRGLARVRFHGDDATATQSAYTPADVAGFFAPDAATVFYNYSTSREDLAMLFEILMMHARFGVELDHAVTNQPRGDNVTGDDYIVTWGQRNRLGEHSVRERARYAVARLLPEVSLDAYIDALPPPRDMREGESWNANLALDPEPMHKALGKTGSDEQTEQPVETLHGYH